MSPNALRYLEQQEITAEQERHARQAAAMAAFRAAERDESAAQFGKEHADAAVEKMKSRLEKLKAIQVQINLHQSKHTETA